MTVGKADYAAWLQVGPPYIMHREDMETVAPLWYHFTKEVRNDPGVRIFPGFGASMRLHCSVALPALLSALRSLTSFSVG